MFCCRGIVQTLSSPATPVTSTSGSTYSDSAVSKVLLEETDTGANNAGERNFVIIHSTFLQIVSL